MSCKSCNTLNNSCSCSSDTVSSDKVTYMGDKYVCNAGGQQRFVLKPCESMTTIANTLATQICELWNNSGSNIYSADGTIVDDIRTVTIPTAGTDGKLLFGPILLTADKKNSIVGVGTDNPFVDQVSYASSANYAARFVVRTADDRYGLNHNNGTIELASYIFNTAGAYWGTVSNHDYILMTGDTARAVIDTNGNFGVGEFTPSAKIHAKGIDATSNNYALKAVDFSGSDLFTVRNDSFVSINGATQGTTEVFGVSGNGKFSGGIGLLNADFTTNKGINMPANRNMMAIDNITIFAQVSDILKLTMNTTNQFDFGRTDGNVVMSLIHTTRDLTDLFLDSSGVNAANPSANTRVSFNSSYAGDTNLRKLAYVEHAITNDTTGDSNITINIGGVEVARFDESATAGDTKFMIYDVDNATLERVTVGAADSGGVGFKLLRIPN